jgi:transposase-like protein
VISRNRTPSKYVYYGLHLYFSGLSLRKASERLSQLYKRNHVAIWNWIQKYRPQKLKATRRRIQEYVVDATMLKVWSEYIWLWVAIEPENRQILALFLPKVSKKETCLLLKDIFLVWSKFMESIQSLQRWRYLVPKWHVSFSSSTTISILPWRKV